MNRTLNVEFIMNTLDWSDVNKTCALSETMFQYISRQFDNGEQISDNQPHETMNNIPVKSKVLLQIE